MARVRAPELIGRGGWIGASTDFGLSSLGGKVVVLHFFTASCINCVRVLQELRPIEERFASEAVVVGVHSPKFPREHEHAAVEHAVERLGIRHPVLDDPDLTTWQQYGVKGWPTLVVIDPEAYVVGGISGEGTGAVVFATVEKTIAEHDEKGTLSRGAVPGLWGSTVASGFRTLNYPAGIAVDGSGRRLAIADTGNGRVVVCDLQGRVEKLYPLFNNPRGVRFDGDRLVVCDTGNDRIVIVDRESGTHERVVDGLASPWDVAIAGDGSFMVAEAGRHRLQRVTDAATVAAGTGQENLVDGPASGALLAQPSGIASLPDGGFVFVDAEASALRVLTAGGEVVTLVGQGLFDWGASDGGPNASAMQHPLGVAVGPADAAGALPPVYAADTLNHRVRVWRGNEWRAESGALSTVTNDILEEPNDLDVLPDGRLVVADTNHHQIVIIDPSTGDTDILRIDETWLGTAVADALDVRAGATIDVAFAAELEEMTLDTTAGPPVRVTVSSDPSTLLGAGPRRWALDDAKGTVPVCAGSTGAGILVVELEVNACDDARCTVLRQRSRHDLTITDSETT